MDNALEVFSRTLVAGKLGCLCVPSLDGVTQLLVLTVVELELLAPQSAELAEHVGEDIREESAILLRRELAEAIQAVAPLEHHEIGEVPRLGSSDYREHLVDRQLLTAQYRRRARRFDWEQPSVVSRF